MTSMRSYLHWKVYHALAHPSDLASFQYTKMSILSHIFVRFVIVRQRLAADSFSQVLIPFMRLLLPVNCFGLVCLSNICTTYLC